MKSDSWNPDQYHRFQAERSLPFQDLLSLVKPVPGGDAVDLGCGSGELTVELHEKLELASTLGVDNSPAMLTRAESLKQPGVRFVNQRIEDFQGAEDLDLIFSNAALHWCENHRALFLTFRKRLRKNGQLAIQMPVNHDYPTHTLARQMMKEEPYRDFFPKGPTLGECLLSAEEYARILFRLGFAEQRVFTQVYGHVLTHRDEVLEWVKGSLLTAFESRLPRSLYPLFLDEYRNRLHEQLPDERPFFYPFKRIHIWGRVPG